MGIFNPNIPGNAATADLLRTARLIGGVSFNGGANINLPGVNAAGNQSTSGNAGSATRLAVARLIGGVSFDGQTDINLPGVNAAGNQNTSGNAATATNLTGDETNWASNARGRAVAGLIGWKKYGNAHVIFDASDGTSPAGTIVNNTNPENPWIETYATLMGWNGVNTFGVRVDTAKRGETVFQNSGGPGGDYRFLLGLANNGYGTVYNGASILYNTETQTANFNISGNAATAFGYGTVAALGAGIVAQGYQNVAQTGGSAPYAAARAWVNFNGTGTPSINNTQNVSSITDNGVGDYYINFAIALPDANYTVSGHGTRTASGPTLGTLFPFLQAGGSAIRQAPLATGFRIACQNFSGGAFDDDYITLSVFR
jgi:hypothetical protein